MHFLKLRVTNLDSASKNELILGKVLMNFDSFKSQTMSGPSA
jgi:hypothetical protein